MNKYYKCDDCGKELNIREVHPHYSTEGVHVYCRKCEQTATEVEQIEW